MPFSTVRIEAMSVMSPRTDSTPAGTLLLDASSRTSAWICALCPTSLWRTCDPMVPVLPVTRMVIVQLHVAIQDDGGSCGEQAQFGNGCATTDRPATGTAGASGGAGRSDATDDNGGSAP
jgi:hypothetical protein